MRQLTRTVASLGWTLLLLVGVPVGLVWLAGWPLPTHVPGGDELAGWVRQPLTRDTVLAAAACVAWLMWAALLAAVLSEVSTRAARLCRGLCRVQLPGPLQGLSAAMLGTVAVSTAAAGTTAAAAHAPATATATADPTTPTGAAAPAGTPGLAEDATPADGRHAIVTVRPGDTLSGIAADRLGDAERWPEIFALNRGTHFSDVGGTLTDPDLIYPGWTLRLPDSATPPAGTRPATPAPPAASDQSAAPATPTVPSAPLPPNQAASPSVATPRPPSAPTTAASPRDADGVATAAPTGTCAPAGAATTAHPGPTGAARRPGPQPTRPRGVPLPGGSWVDLGLALAVVTATALVWAHRRHRYTRRPPTAQPRPDDPDLATMPPVVNQIRRGLRRAGSLPALGHDEPADGDGGELLIDTDTHETDPARPAVSGGTDDAPFDDDGDAADDDDPDDAGAWGRHNADPLPAPVLPSLANPPSAPWPAAGLGLTGPGAHAAARGFLTAALATGTAGDPHARTWVVMPRAMVAALLGTAAAGLPDTPRLIITAGLGDACDLLDAQTLHRSRIIDQHQVDTVAALRRTDPLEEPLPPVMLLADVADAGTRQERARVAALLSQGRRLDIHGVLLGAWPGGTTVVVADDGTTTPADGHDVRHDGDDPADVGRLTVLNPGETVALLATLAESHTGQPPPSAFPVADMTAGARHAGQAADHGADHADDGAVPAAAATGASDIASASPTARAANGDHLRAGGANAAPAARPPSQAGSNDERGDDQPLRPGRVEVTVLGRPRILGGDPQRPLRAKSLELLVYLAARDGDAAAEAILDDLLPDAPVSKAAGRLYTYVSDLRTALRRTGGPGSYLTHPDRRYVLNRGTIDVDLWRMRAAIRAAEQASDHNVRVAALRRAVDAYTGPLADGCDYEWIEPYREAVRQQALDACLALADTLADQPREALAVLEPALRHSPYAEPLYQAAMRAHAALGHLDAVRTLRRTLTRRLGEIDAEPGDDTIALADQLVAGLRRPGHGLSPAPRPEDGDAA